jgi:hypothetical protein
VRAASFGASMSRQSARLDVEQWERHGAVAAEAYALGLVTRQIDARNEQNTALARLTELSGMPVTQVPPSRARRTSR